LNGILLYILEQLFFFKRFLNNKSYVKLNNIDFILTVIGSGVIIVGFIGLWIIRELLWRNNKFFVVFLLQSPRILRFFLLLGLGHAFYGLLGAIRTYVKAFLFRFGEHILEVE